VELEALDRTLQLLQGHELFNRNVAQVNTIRAMALTCRIPLQEFLKQLEKYEKSMGPFATNKASFSTFARKSQWAVLMADDVARLRTTIGAKVRNIQLLLGLHISTLLSRIEAHAHEARDAAMADALAHKTDIVAVHKAVDNSASDQRQRLGRLDNKADNAAVTLGVISTTVTRTATIIIVIKDVASQLLLLVRDLPQHIREAFEPFVRTNFEIFTMVQDIHTILVQAPSQTTDLIYLEQSPGELRPLLYAKYRHFENFSALIQDRPMNKIVAKVTGRNAVFRYIDSLRKTTDDKKWVELDRNLEEILFYGKLEDRWSTAIFPGSRIEVCKQSIASDSTDACIDFRNAIFLTIT
jgi:hypothetical protein